MPRIVQPTPDMIAEAAGRMRGGGVVAFPTETVYGLGGDTFNVNAIELIYEMKGRPANNPLIAHVLDTSQAREIVSQWDERCDQLVRRFWPGPLTLVLPKASRVPSVATAGRNTIALRSPSHPVARRLLERFGGPTSAPSANRSGHVSPTTAHHVADDFASTIDELLILDGGPCEVGLESTVLDLTAPVPTVLRPGSVTVEMLREVLGSVNSPIVTEQAASPGTSAAHYAPCTPAELVDSTRLILRLSELASAAVLCFDDSQIAAPHKSIVMPKDVNEYAAAMYGALRMADAMCCERILIERPPESSGVWQAVHDRLNRACVINE